MDFPKKPNSSLKLEDLTSLLLQINSIGLPIYKLGDSDGKYEIQLNQEHSIKCSFSGNKCQVQLAKSENMVHYQDASTPLALEQIVQQYIKRILGDYPVQPLSARVSSDTPSTNFQKISNLIGGNEIIGVFDPYLNNSALGTLITICSFGNGSIGNDIKLLGSTRTSSGNNPKLTRGGVDAFLIQVGKTGQIKILPNEREHRRFLLLTGGKSLILGQSLNSIHKNEALRIEADTEDKLFFDQIWSQSTVLT